MFAAADVYASEEALVNVLPHLKDNARIAAFGAKLSSNGFGRIFNPFLKLLFNLSFSTTVEDQPVGRSSFEPKVCAEDRLTKNGLARRTNNSAKHF